MISFRLLSFNVRGAYPERQTERQWPVRAQVNVRTIQQIKPDLIGFQEVHPENATTYAAHLPEYAVTVGRDEPATTWIHYNPIYYRRETFDLRASGGFFLSPTPDEWSKGWDAAFVRSVTWARLSHKASGAELLHCNVHLDHVGEESRLNSAALILERLAEIAAGVPVVLTGDFNSRAWSPPDEDQIRYPPAVYRDKLPPGNTVYKVLIDGGFRDTYIESGYRDQLNMNTFHAFMGENFPSCALRIDWILLRDGDSRQIETERFDIVRGHDGAIYPSDHYPVLAEIALP